MYICNPNNPDGKVFSAAELAAVARFAQKHDLWVISDEVYEHYVYDGRKHVSIASLSGMHERTMTAFSFSKTYGQAGLRVGYVVGPADAVAAVRKMSNHTVYSVPRAMQRAAQAALLNGDRFLQEARARYTEARDYVCAHLQAPNLQPEGSTYVFVDLGEWIAHDKECSLSVLERMAAAGMLLAPGVSFGRGFRNWARLCFSAAPLPVIQDGVARFNAVLDQIPK
jgi:aspartate/methionine/tyrosine aminotransferase